MSNFSFVKSVRECMESSGYTNIHIWETFDGPDSTEKYILIATEPVSGSTVCEVVSPDEVLDYEN